MDYIHIDITQTKHSWNNIYVYYLQAFVDFLFQSSQLDLALLVATYPTDVMTHRLLTNRNLKITVLYIAL